MSLRCATWRSAGLTLFCGARVGVPSSGGRLSQALASPCLFGGAGTVVLEELHPNDTLKFRLYFVRA